MLCLTTDVTLLVHPIFSLPESFHLRVELSRHQQGFDLRVRLPLESKSGVFCQRPQLRTERVCDVRGPLVIFSGRRLARHFDHR